MSELVSGFLRAAGANVWAIVSFWLATTLSGVVVWVGKQITTRRYVHIDELTRVETDYKAQLAAKDVAIAKVEAREQQAIEETRKWQIVAFRLGDTNSAFAKDVVKPLLDIPPAGSAPP